jgi:hypothetical protein
MIKNIKVMSDSRFFRMFLFIGMTASFSECGGDQIKVNPTGVIKYYSHVPASCNTTRGLKQSLVKQVKSEKELRAHYGLTFRVWFNDRATESLYGSLYYQNAEQNKYCMALPDGRFAVFGDKPVGPHKKNIAHEVCYPIKDCFSDDWPFQEKCDVC